MRSIVLFAGAMLVAGCARQVQVGSGAGPGAAKSDAIVSADQLITAMRERYSGKWFRTITFTQKSTYLRPDGTPSRTETWYEAAALPGRLRIDLGEPSKGNGVLYRRDSLYSLQGGKISDRRAGRNILLILGFDVYAQPTARTMDQLRAERVDVATLRTDELNGTKVYVVGAGPNDLTANQFWVDAGRLVVLRVIQSNAEKTRTQDVRFEKYTQHGGAWVAEELRMLMGARMIFHEEYSNVRVNVPLDDALFLPERWTTAPHWYTP